MLKTKHQEILGEPKRILRHLKCLKKKGNMHQTPSKHDYYIYLEKPKVGTICYLKIGGNTKQNLSEDCL